MVNKYGYRCQVCGEWVAARRGSVEKVNGRWAGYCAEHQANNEAAVDFSQMQPSADGWRPRVHHMYSPVTGNHWTSCNCEDYPCCGH